jgi:hypothetical protein
MNAIQNAAKKSKRKSMENIIGTKLATPKLGKKSSDGFNEDNLSQTSEKSTDSKKSRRRLLENVQDSFKSMFSITSPRSTGSRSPGPGHRSPKSDSGSGGNSGRRSPILSKLHDVFHASSPRINVEPNKEVESEKIDFDCALTIVGDSTELKNFNESFLFSHRLDIVGESNEESKSSLFEIKTKEESVRVQISNISSTEELDQISNKFSSLAHHSYIILHSEEVEDHFDTWMDIIGSYGLAGNLIVVYQNGGKELKKKEKKLSERFVLSYVRFLTIDYSSPSKLVDVEKCLQKALKNNSPFNEF